MRRPPARAILALLGVLVTAASAAVVVDTPPGASAAASDPHAFAARCDGDMCSGYFEHVTTTVPAGATRATVRTQMRFRTVGSRDVEHYYSIVASSRNPHAFERQTHGLARRRHFTPTTTRIVLPHLEPGSTIEFYYAGGVDAPSTAGRAATIATHLRTTVVYK